jgi:hypothetical protein
MAKKVMKTYQAGGTGGTGGRKRVPMSPKKPMSPPPVAKPKPVAAKGGTKK